MSDEFRVDMHVKLLDERVVERAKARGLDALVYAPHFVRLPEVAAAAERYTDEELLVVPARELFTGSWRDRKHILALGLSEPVPDFLSLEATMAELERQGAAVLVPHPEFATVSLDEADVDRYADLVDAVETYNPKHWARHNRRAQAVAAATGKPAFGSSYAHLRSTVGEVWTRFEEPFETAADLVDALARGAPRRVFHRDGTGHRLRCTAEFSHLFYENTVDKAAKLLAGAKPTNPYHPAYDARFHEAAVYGRPQVRSFQDR